MGGRDAWAGKERMTAHGAFKSAAAYLISFKSASPHSRIARLAQREYPFPNYFPMANLTYCTSIPKA